MKKRGNGTGNRDSGKRKRGRPKNFEAFLAATIAAREARKIGNQHLQQMLLWLRCWRVVDVLTVARRVKLGKTSAYELVARARRDGYIRPVAAYTRSQAYMLTPEGAEYIREAWLAASPELSAVPPSIRPGDVGANTVVHNLLVQHAVLDLCEQQELHRLVRRVAEAAGYQTPGFQQIEDHTHFYSPREIGPDGLGLRLAHQVPDALVRFFPKTVDIRVAVEVQQTDDSTRLKKLSLYAEALNLPHPRAGQAETDEDRRRRVDAVVYWSTRPHVLEHVQAGWNEKLPPYARYVLTGKNRNGTEHEIWRMNPFGATPWRQEIADRLMIIPAADYEAIYYFGRHQKLAK